MAIPFLFSTSFSADITVATTGTFGGMITVNGGGIDIDNNDDVRLRFDNASVFKAGLQVATTAGDMIAGSSINDFAIRSQSNMLFATGGNTERMRISSAGKVGIGMTPTYKVDIEANNQRMRLLGTTGFVAIELQNSSNGFYYAIEGASGGNFATGTSAYSGVLAKQGNYKLALATNGVVRQTITGAGDVGIGTTSPEDKLEVSGGSLKIKVVGTAALASSIKLGRSDQADGNFENHIASMTGSGASQCQIQFLVCNTSATGRTQLLTLDGGNARSIFQGNVGIGTTSPAQRLDVAGNVVIPYANAYLMDTTGAGGSNFLKTINDFETVVGTNRGSAGFGVFGNSNIRLGFGNNYTAAETKLTIIPNGSIQFNAYDSTNKTGTPTYVLGTDASGNVVKVLGGDIPGAGYWAESGANIYKTNTGNVGIGTTNPNGGNLHVQMTGVNTGITNVLMNASFNEAGGVLRGLNIGYRTDENTAVFAPRTATGNLAFYNYDGAWAETARFTNTGRFGIGDTLPVVKLQVSTNSPTNNVATLIGDGWVGSDAYHKEGGLLLISGTSQDSTQTGAGIAFQTRTTANSNYWKSSIIMDRDGAIRFTLGGAGTSAGSEDFTILSNGKIGIGITAPQSKLHVAQAGNVNGGSILMGATGSGTTKWSYLAGAHFNQSTGSGNGSGSAGIALIGAFANSTANNVYIGGSPYELNAATSINFWTNPTNLSTLGGVQRMQISGAGMVTFNTYSGTNFTGGTPAYLLSVDGSGNIIKTNTVPGSGAGPYLPVASPTFTGTLTGPNANFTSTVTIDNMLTITIDDISTGENRGLRLINEAGTDQQWNITAGTTGITNDDFCIRDSTNNVNAFRLSEVTGNATFAGAISTTYVTSGGFSDGFVTWNGAQFNRPGAAIEFQFAGSANSLVKFGANGSNPVVINANTGKVTGAATLAADGVSTLTTKSYVDGLVTGVPVYKGTWDARNVAEGGTTDGGTPDLRLAANKVLGNYYIVSTAGSASPNGGTTEPNSWNVGDWCIFSDITPGAGTDLWQKIDNTSVISGAGTGQKVTKWAGAGPSETLTDGPITFNTSDNNSAFAGNVTVLTGSSSGSLTVGRNAQENIVINVSDNTNSLTAFQDSDGNGPHSFVLDRIFAGTGTNDFRIRKNGTDQLTIDTSANATFSGNVDLGNASNITMGVGAPGQLRVKGSGYTGAIALDASAMYVYHDSSLRDLVLGTNETARLTIDGSNGNATFSSTVQATTYLINKTSAAGIGTSLGDINGAELGPGYLTVSRDDTADAKQLSFYKNNVEHSFFLTTTFGLNIGGTNVGIGTNKPGSKLVLNTSTVNPGSMLELNNRGDVTVGSLSIIRFGLDSNTYPNQYGKGGIIYESRDGFNRGKLHLAVNNVASTANVGIAGSILTVDGTTSRVGIGTVTPNSKLQIVGKATSSSTVSADAATTLVTKDYVDSSAGNPSHFRQGFKTQTVGTAFSTVLTVNLSNHTGCYVTVCCFGDWGSHSSAAYRGEFFLQNGANSYNEPGIIIRQDDNTSDGTDQIVCQIVDNPSTANPKDFAIQIKHTDPTSPASFNGTVTFTVQGQFNSVT